MLNTTKKWMIVGFAAAVFWTTQSGIAMAHVRDYIVSQQYYTTKKGEFELEVYTDYNMPNKDDSDTHNLKQQFELEYGITDHWQVAYYEVAKWNREKDYFRDALKIESKYRFAETGEWPVDVAIYGEYEGPNGHQDNDSDALEGKLILSKDFGNWNVIGNLILERKINEHDFWEVAYTLGTSYAFSAKTRLGLELKETLGDTDEFGMHHPDHQIQLLPGIYSNLTPHVRVLFGPAIGLTHATDDLQIKSIVEIEF